VIISGCHWSYSTSAFGGATDGLRSWPEGDSLVTLNGHERPSKDRREISRARRLPRVDFVLEAVGSPLLERLTVLERPGIYRFRFWQEGGGYDRNLRSVKAVEAAIAYIHENPVPRQLCERSADWRWSSARHYEQDGQGAGRLEVPPTIHGLTWDFYV
jgi:hypothetical protein